MRRQSQFARCMQIFSPVQIMAIDIICCDYILLSGCALLFTLSSNRQINPAHIHMHIIYTQSCDLCTLLSFIFCWYIEKVFIQF
jgi:hypothetical protein